MMCSVHRLNKQGDSRQLCHSFSVLNQSVVPYKVLTVASWPTYKFPRRQIRWSLRVSTVCYDPHYQRLEYSQWNRGRCFLKFPCFLYDPANVSNLISGSSAFSKPSLNIWKFSVHIILKPSLEDFGHNLTMGDECNCPMVWTFFTSALLGNWDENWPFPVLWPLLGLPDLLA